MTSSYNYMILESVSASSWLSISLSDFIEPSCLKDNVSVSHIDTTWSCLSKFHLIFFLSPFLSLLTTTTLFLLYLPTIVNFFFSPFLVFNFFLLPSFFFSFTQNSVFVPMHRLKSNSQLNSKYIQANSEFIPDSPSIQIPSYIQERVKVHSVNCQISYSKAHIKTNIA